MAAASKRFGLTAANPPNPMDDKSLAVADKLALATVTSIPIIMGKAVVVTVDDETLFLRLMAGCSWNDDGDRLVPPMPRARRRGEDMTLNPFVLVPIKRASSTARRQERWHFIWSLQEQVV